MKTKNIEYLISGMTSSPDDFSQLQVFLHGESTDISISNYEYLMVTPSTFGKVKLLDLSVEDQDVILEVQDCTTQITGKIRIDVDEVNPTALFISWHDVKNMVHSENQTSTNMSGLLEFDF